jgi:hypothetical protein
MFVTGTAPNTVENFILTGTTNLTEIQVGKLSLTTGNIHLDEDQKIYFEADKGSYIESNSADRIRLVAGGSQMMVWDQDNSRVVFGYGQKVYIGNNNNAIPTNELEVAGTISGENITGSAISGSSGVFAGALTVGGTISGAQADITSGEFSNGLSAGNGTLDVSAGEIKLGGQLLEGVEDLGTWTTGYSPHRQDYQSGMLTIPVSGNSLKSLVINDHATGLVITGATLGATTTIKISGKSDAAFLTYAFLSGSDVNWLGVDPIELKPGSVGLLSVIAHGPNQNDCFCHWAQTT